MQPGAAVTLLSNPLQTAFKPPSNRQRLQQLRFNFNLRLVVLQLRAVDQKGVFYPFAQGYMQQLAAQLPLRSATLQALRQAMQGNWERLAG